MPVETMSKSIANDIAHQTEETLAKVATVAEVKGNLVRVKFTEEDVAGETWYVSTVVGLPVSTKGMVLPVRGGDGYFQPTALPASYSKAEVDALIAGVLSADSVTASQIAANAVGTSELADNSVTNAKMADNSVGAAEIAALAVGTSELADKSVTAAKIADNTITALQIAADAVGASELAPKVVVAGHLADNTLTATQIATNAIGAAELGDGIVTATHLAAGSVGASEIAANIITAGHIAANAIGASELADGAVLSTNIGADQVTADKFGPFLYIFSDTSINTTTNTAAASVVVNQTNSVAIPAGYYVWIGIAKFHAEAIGADASGYQVINRFTAEVANGGGAVVLSWGVDATLVATWMVAQYEAASTMYFQQVWVRASGTIGPRRATLQVIGIRYS